MDVLKTGLVNIGHENSEAKWYIPWLKLDQLFDSENVKHAINDSGLEPYKQDEAINRILNGGKRVFATLIQCGNASAIARFLEKDHLQHQALDAKLPYSRSDLASIFDNSTDAELFYRTQWTVSAPSFRGDMSHRDFEREVILPFVRSVEFASGAFGTVYETALDPLHQADVANANLPMVCPTQNLTLSSYEHAGANLIFFNLQRAM